ncbi:hypothetical protein [Bradyrhizobium sp. HKCCYLS20291]|uniref:hypothetical protein n=1 Tax=Bradyrhizobium sp. HKCCYLS20291 TaxID=3420766 RepID=UPI003EBB3958
MTDQISKAAPKTSREERLKQALRENLKRRKAQSRERSQVAADDASSDQVAPGDQDDVTR